LHHGENKVRIYQGALRKERKYSASVTVVSNRPSPIELVTQRFREEIEFSGPTAYELFNEYGTLVKKGHGKKVDISRLDKGVYYLNYSSVAGREIQIK
jgi:hypothetical protein